MQLLPNKELKCTRYKNSKDITCMVLWMLNWKRTCTEGKTWDAERTGSTFVLTPEVIWGCWQGHNEKEDEVFTVWHLTMVKDDQIKLMLEWSFSNSCNPALSVGDEECPCCFSGSHWSLFEFEKCVRETRSVSTRKI